MGARIGDLLYPIDFLEWDADQGREPAIIHISGQVYAIAYMGPDTDGWINTITIDGSGNAALTGHSLEYDADYGRCPSIVHVAGNVYAIAYQGPDSHGWIKTVAITEAGALALTGYSLEFDPGYAHTPYIIHVAGDVYAVVYGGTDNDGWIKTVTIGDAGALALTGHSLEFDTDYGMDPSTIHVAGDVYAIAYTGPDNHGRLKTVTISAAGALALTGHSLEFDDTQGMYCHIVHISGDIYAIAYNGPDENGWVCTVEITGAGSIGAAPIASFEFNPTGALYPFLIPVGDDTYAIFYRGPGFDGWVGTIRISAEGFIKGLFDTLEFDKTIAEYPSVVHVGGDIFAVAYQGPDDDGRLKTLRIRTTAPDKRGKVFGAHDYLEFDEQSAGYPSMIHVCGTTYAIAYHNAYTGGRIKTAYIDPDGNAMLTGYSLNFDTDGYDSKLVHVAGGVYAVCYRGPDGDGWIKTFTIAIDGALVLTGHSLEFDTLRGSTPDIVHVASGVYAIAYKGDGSDGWIKTVTIGVDGSLVLTGHSLEFDPVYGGSPSLVHLGGSLYAIAYESNDWANPHGSILTVAISTAGAITVTGESLEFEDTHCEAPRLAHIAGETYAVVYEGPDEGGLLKTVTIDAAIGAIALTGSSLEFSSRSLYPEIVRVASDVYAIVSIGGPGLHGYIDTVSIAPDGTISPSVIDTFEFVGISSTADPCILHLAQNIFAICYQSANKGRLCTVNITAALTGDIRGIISELEFDSAMGVTPRAIHIAGGVYAIVYTGPDWNEGRLKTVTIGVDGALALTGHSLEFDDTQANWPVIIHVAGDVYAIAYQGPDTDGGWIKTVTIGVDGSLALTGYSLEFEADVCDEPDITHVAGDVYAVAYQMPPGGQLKTVTIGVDGALALTGHSLDFEVGLCTGPDIIHVAEDVYAIAYRGPDNDGWIKTVTIGVDGSLALTGRSLEFDESYARRPRVINLGGDGYAVVYQGGNSDMVTFLIKTDGVIEPVIDSAQFPASIEEPWWVYAGGSIHAVAMYVPEGMGVKGQAVTVGLDPHGNIGDDVLGEMEFQPFQFDPIRPAIIHVAGDVYAITYQGAGQHGWIKTLQIALEKKATPAGGLSALAVADLLLS